MWPPPTRRLPPFFQTSLRADKLITFRRWQLETYVDLINVVRGVNPEFELYNYDYTDFAYVRGFPFVPNLGLARLVGCELDGECLALDEAQRTTEPGVFGAGEISDLGFHGLADPETGAPMPLLSMGQPVTKGDRR